MHDDKRPDNRRLGDNPPAERLWIVQGYTVWRTSRQFVPPTDVIELQDRLRVIVEIAGMRPADFSITLHNNRLIITGTRERRLDQTAAYHQVEIGHGAFRVDVALPWAVDRAGVAANYRDGFLQVDLPRRADDGQVQVIDVTFSDETEGVDPNE
ncbi:MAG: Hsp20/alpha crystallin family protein [Chloroflexi bacterium]|nr:Hsp20/alpha crystallin family protein [Chloroflexota bacterium]